MRAKNAAATILTGYVINALGNFLSKAKDQELITKYQINVGDSNETYKKYEKEMDGFTNDLKSKMSKEWKNVLSKATTVIKKSNDLNNLKTNSKKIIDEFTKKLNK